MTLKIQNKEFGDLTAEECLGSRRIGANKHVFWRCRCKCGKTRDVPAGKLNALEVTACLRCSRQRQGNRMQQKAQRVLEAAPRHAEVVRLWQETDMSKSAIGRQVGISGERVRQILEKEGAL